MGGHLGVIYGKGRGCIECLNWACIFAQLMFVNELSKVHAKVQLSLSLFLLLSYMVSTLLVKKSKHNILLESC